MAKRITVEEIEERIKRIHGDAVVLIREAYKGTGHKASFIDKDYGEFSATIHNVLHGTKHKKHAHIKTGERNKESSFLKSFNKTKTSSLEKVQKAIYKKHGDNVKIIPETYIRAKIKAQFLDKEFGLFWCEPTYVITRGYRHPNYGKTCRIIDIEEIKKRIFDKYGDLVVLVENTYKSNYKKATFIDKERGEFSSTTKMVVYGHGHPSREQEKREATHLERYGVKNPQQNLEIALKTAKSSNKSIKKIHWKTNEELICIGS